MCVSFTFSLAYACAYCKIKDYKCICNIINKIVYKLVYKELVN